MHGFAFDINKMATLSLQVHAIITRLIANSALCAALLRRFLEHTQFTDRVGPYTVEQINR